MTKSLMKRCDCYGSHFRASYELMYSTERKLMSTRPSLRLLVPLCLTASLFLLVPDIAIAWETVVDINPLAARLRQPVALAFAEGGKILLVCNHRSSSVSVIDTTERRVVAEYDVGRALVDLVSLTGGERLLALDQSANELLLLDDRDRSIRVVDRIKVSPDPVRLVVLADGSSCVVASLWSRRLTFIGLKMRLRHHWSSAFGFGRLDLPFCPREMALNLDGSKLIVADAFSGRLAVVDVRHRTIETVRSLPRTTSAGLAFAPDGQTLVVAHQVLNRLAQSSFDDVHWGQLIRNHLRVLQTDPC